MTWLEMNELWHAIKWWTDMVPALVTPSSSWISAEKSALLLRRVFALVRTTVKHVKVVVIVVSPLLTISHKQFSRQETTVNLTQRNAQYFCCKNSSDSPLLNCLQLQCSSALLTGTPVLHVIACTRKLWRRLLSALHIGLRIEKLTGWIRILCFKLFNIKSVSYQCSSGGCYK